MFAILKNRSTHASHLERWLGAEGVERLSAAMKPWYYKPIAVHSVPGNVWACPGGDFHGAIGAGQLGSGIDFAIERLKKAFKRAALRQVLQPQLHMAGFASLSDLIAEYTAGKTNTFALQKVGQTGVVSVTSSLWGSGNQPAAGGNAGNAPGGTASSSATVGGFPYTNPTGGDTQHLLRADIRADFVNTLLMYDRTFAVNKTMASTATEAVTGVPTRYQSVVTTDPDFCGGSFLFVEVGGTQLAATAHNWTVCQYTDQDGNATQTLPSLTGNSAGIIWRLDHPTGQWFAPLASGDYGIKVLTQMQCSASVATGVINFVIGHPLAWVPIPIVNLVMPIDGLRSAFNLVRILDNACISFLEVMKPATSATAYTGTFTTAWG